MAQIIIFILSLGFVFAGNAFELDQTYFQMTTNGLDSKKTLTLKNDRSEKRLITVEVFERRVNSKSGVEERFPTQDFKISEKTMTLPPHAESKLTLDWAGLAQLKTEKAYRLVLTEVKNQQKDNVSEFKSPLIQYVASVFVTPENAKDNVKMVKSEVVEKSKLEITLTNTGNKHKLLSEAGLQIQDLKDKKVQQKYHKLEAFQQAILMPGQTKKIIVPTEVDWKNKKLLVSIVNE
jgi:P pilus assembly chaperone PapD